MSKRFRSLVIKDLKLLSLPGLAWLALNLFFTFVTFFSSITGTNDLAFALQNNNFDGQAFIIAIVIAIFAPLIMFKEADSRTISFLDQLPVSRFTHLLSRYLSALIWLIGGSFTSIALDAGAITLFSLETEQISTFKVYGNYALTQLYFTVMFLPTMMLISLMRGIYIWITTAFFIYLIIVYSLEDIISEAENRAYGYRNILAATDLTFIENTVLFQMQPALALFVLGIASFPLAAIGYFYIGKPLPHLAILRFWKYTWVKAILVISSVTVLSVVLIKQFSGDKILLRDKFRADNEYANKTELVVSETDSFIWMMEAHDLDRFGTLVDQGEQIYQDLLTTLQQENYELADPITVVPTNKIQTFAAGTAHWKRIKLAGNLKDPEMIERVFRHELVHVVIELWSDGALREHFDFTGIFHEGTAKYFEQASPNKLAQILRQAIVNHTWNQCIFDDLFDFKNIASARGQQFVYSYGWLFVASLVERHGSNIIPIIAQSFRQFRGSKLKGLSLWQAVLQKSGVSIEEVRSDFALKLLNLEKKNAALITHLPKPSAQLIIKDGKYYLKPSVMNQLNNSSLIADFDPSGTHQKIITPNKEGLINVPKEHVKADCLEVQLGWLVQMAPADASDSNKDEYYWSNLSKINLSR